MTTDDSDKPERPLIVEHKQKLPEPQVGWELIAIGKGEPTRLKDHRLSISERVFGGYSFVQVDVAEHRLTQTRKVPTRVPGLSFDAALTAQYCIADPVVAVKRSTRLARDTITGIVWPRIEAASRGAGAGGSTTGAQGKLTLEDLDQAQSRVDQACKELLKDERLGKRGLELLDLSATVNFDTETAKLAAAIGLSGLKIDAQRAEGDVQVDARKHYEALIAEGPRPLFAEVMRTNPGMISGLLEQLSAAERQRYENDISLMRELFAEGHIEGHHLPPNVRDEFLRSVLNRASLGDILTLGVSTKPTVPAVEDDSGKS
ncbi:hypothetical protein [Phenylobacterium sp.]|uniref:hypothetical protein n=1 Tax=Phenylobacterium sp. TaxID=1871053 RepID=UPI0025E282EC|nr:hypothetical protein [Phenylobacterium sp.]MBX3484702.1 hypothetical protein [Phenylobacterium sp.]MCW5759717.1 hypothetical protein [Phenylobacterium sp.]